MEWSLDVSMSKSLSTSSLSSIQDFVVGIMQQIQQPTKSLEHVTIGPPYLQMFTNLSGVVNNASYTLGSLH